MSGEEGHEPPAATAETTPVTMAIVQYLSGIRELHGTTPLRQDNFNMESTQEIYLLTQGPRRESLFDMGTFQGFGGQTLGPSGVGGVTTGQAWITKWLEERKDYLLAEEDEKEDEVEQRLGVLEGAQGKFQRDLEEVI
ncbi:UNVERIFIED_CONTAM: hypothetical protein K2H54_003480 [Gekko kuhli]